MPTKTYYSVAGEIIAEETGGVRTDYITDALGSIVGTVDSSQAVVNTYRFKPYGALLAKTGTAPDPRFLWTGNTGSRTTNLNRAEQYNRARHLGVREGTWTSVDPLWPDEWAYGYVKGNPTTWTDSNGTNPSGSDCSRNFPECPNPDLLLDLIRLCKNYGTFPCTKKHDVPVSLKVKKTVCCTECYSACSNALKVKGGVVCDGSDEKEQIECARNAIRKFKRFNNTANLSPWPVIKSMDYCDLCAAPDEDLDLHFQWKCRSKGKVITAACCPCYESGRIKMHCLTVEGCHQR